MPLVVGRPLHTDSTPVLSLVASTGDYKIEFKKKKKKKGDLQEQG